MEVGAIEVAVLTLVGGFIGKGIDWVKTWYLSRSEQKKTDSQVKIEEQKATSAVITSEVEKAGAMYREMVVDLRKDIDEMFGLLKTLEMERLDCRVDLATARAELKAEKEKTGANKRSSAYIADEAD